jgi:CheY-like chemotaxis protein
VDPPSAPEPIALGVGQDAAVETGKVKMPNPAPPYQGDWSDSESNGLANLAHSSPESGELASMLLKLLQTGVQGQVQSQGRFNWEQRRVLVCVVPAFREEIARTLAEKKYTVYVAADATQALDRMREERIEAIILDNEFDLAEQGVAFVRNEINSLRPSDRRKLIVAQMSTLTRTGDTHAAFVSNVNVVFNPNDIDQLPLLLERTMRDVNELYKHFNSAMSFSGF